jgi:hypothetical protein
MSTAENRQQHDRDTPHDPSLKRLGWIGAVKLRTLSHKSNGNVKRCGFPIPASRSATAPPHVEAYGLQSRLHLALSICNVHVGRPEPLAGRGGPDRSLDGCRPPRGLVSIDPISRPNFKLCLNRSVTGDEDQSAFPYRSAWNVRCWNGILPKVIHGNL